MNKIILPNEDEDLLTQCKVDAYRASGKGGQHVNVTDSAIRLTHIPTGIVVSCQEERSQLFNKKRCLAKLRKKVEQLNYKKPKRIPTKVPRTILKKRRKEKQKKSQQKELRRPPLKDNDR